MLITADFFTCRGASQQMFAGVLTCGEATLGNTACAEVAPVDNLGTVAWRGRYF